MPLVVPIALMHGFSHLHAVVNIGVVLIPLVGTLHVVLRSNRVETECHPSRMLLGSDVFQREIEYLPGTFLIRHACIVFNILIGCIESWDFKIVCFIVISNIGIFHIYILRSHILYAHFITVNIGHAELAHLIMIVAVETHPIARRGFHLNAFAESIGRRNNSKPFQRLTINRSKCVITPGKSFGLDIERGADSLGLIHVETIVARLIALHHVSIRTLLGRYYLGNERSL